MDRPWTDSEKVVARSVLKKVESRVRKEVVRRCGEYRIETVEDVWNLEQEIRIWRRDFRYFNLNYHDLEQTLASWMDEGLLKPGEIEKLDADRLIRIKGRRK